MDWSIIDNNDVVILDFSFSESIIQEIKQRSNSFKLIDHHVSAFERLQNVEGCSFDMNECGSSLTWKLLSDDPLPLFLEYVRANDLYLGHMPYSQEFYAGLNTLD